MADAQEVKAVRLHRFDSDSKTKAFADIAIGDFIVKGLRVVEGKKGLFISMPQALCYRPQENNSCGLRINHIFAESPILPCSTSTLMTLTLSLSPVFKPAS